MIEQQFGATIIMHLPVPLSLEEEAEILLQGLQGQGTLLSWKWEV
jgi:hypothetical protein